MSKQLLCIKKDGETYLREVNDRLYLLKPDRSLRTVFGGDAITNDNLTDSIAESLLKQFPTLLQHFERIPTDILFPEGIEGKTYNDTEVEGPVKQYRNKTLSPTWVYNMPPGILYNEHRQIYRLRKAETDVMVSRDKLYDLVNNSDLSGTTKQFIIELIEEQINNLK